LAWVTVAAAAALFLLERLQVYLPGRTPEITDAVLAVLMGLLLWLLRDA
jgi:VanZ family protein